jgi:hypothetical protein
VSCGDAESSINFNIAAVLNEAFPTTVFDWTGDATFGTFFFDVAQAVSAARLRRLEATPRILQQGTCPSREGIDCEGDLCRWGCVTAATTDCGTSSLTNWPALENDVKARLQALNLPCLGIADELEVILVVKDPEAGAGRAFRSGRDPNDVLTGSEGETRSDSLTRTIKVKSKMQFSFFSGNETAPSEQDVAGVVDEIKSFFWDHLSIDPDFAESFVGFEVDPGHTYSQDSELNFVSLIILDEDSENTPKEAAYAMTTYDFDEFIVEYAQKAEPLGVNHFRDSEWVRFTSAYGSH